MYIVTGIGNILTPTKSVPALQLAEGWAPLVFWGVVFVAVGVCGIISARIPPGRDTWGFALMVGMSLWWSCVYFFGWVTFDVDRAWTSALQWFFSAILLTIVAGWPEAEGR